MTPDVNWSQVKLIFFDCFGTVFDTKPLPDHEIAAYVQHVRQPEFVPYAFSPAWYTLGAHLDSRYGISSLRCFYDLPCVAFSNGSWDLIHKLSRRNNIEWSGITSPTGLEAYKPDRVAYVRAAQFVGYHPEECLMVTANETFGDLEGARDIGMQSILIDRARKYPQMPHTIVELSDLVREARRK